LCSIHPRLEQPWIDVDESGSPKAPHKSRRRSVQEVDQQVCLESAGEIGSPVDRKSYRAVIMKGGYDDIIREAQGPESILEIGERVLDVSHEPRSGQRTDIL